MATVKEIKEALADIDSLDDTRWQAYEKDSRAGVQKLSSSVKGYSSQYRRRLALRTYAALRKRALSSRLPSYRRN